MAVQASELKVRSIVGCLHGTESRAGHQRQAEFLVLVAGGNELVRVRFHAGLHADEHVLGNALLTGDTVQGVQFLVGIHHHVPHTTGDAGTQEGFGLIVAVYGDALRGKIHSQRDEQLILTSHVEGETFLFHPAGNARGQKRFRGIVDVLRLEVRLRHVAAAGTEVLLIHDHDRSAVFRDDV